MAGNTIGKHLESDPTSDSSVGICGVGKSVL